jgi:hypothetical protein
MAQHAAPDKHSLESVQWHEWEAWHVCSSANGEVMTGDHEVTPIKHVPRQRDLWQDAIDTFVKPVLPAVLIMRDLLPPEVRTQVATQRESQGTEMQYIGLNILASKECGCEQFVWEGTCNPKTGEHYGITYMYMYM